MNMLKKKSGIKKVREKRKKQEYDSAIIEQGAQRQHNYFDMVLGERRIVWNIYTRPIMQYIGAKARNYGKKQKPKPHKFSLHKTPDNKITIERVT